MVSFLFQLFCFTSVRSISFSLHPRFYHLHPIHLSPLLPSPPLPFPPLPSPYSLSRARGATITAVCVNMCCLLSVMLQPYMPAVSRELQQQLKVSQSTNERMSMSPSFNEGQYYTHTVYVQRSNSSSCTIVIAVHTLVADSSSPNTLANVHV